MKKLLFLLLSLILISCSHLINEPKNLVNKKTMSQIIAEFALNEQLGPAVENMDLDNATRYTLQQYKIKGSDFADSYEYYTATGEIKKILDDSQEIIKNKDPEAKGYLDKKIKENIQTPSLSN